ncbi:phosphopyruvate hydratase [Candidatus Mycoplasma haematominutum]|uniref:Enolase n=1 Tax=Candidatus Mycoplasma haematominutum 'Birmingham 1' TaxID=1116213 RepID=G8C3L3_9MOLU|nr:phosphopyruvate hydratase [Candidatus Mycoplasma haematominutum]CCE66911.1 enolase [Candidatus Mycoplasma haematominutum 'Birmingham 1']
MGFRIENLFAYELIDSRGNPTVACIAKVSKGGVVGKKTATAKVMVPSGASTGSKEALELRDEDPARFMGKGVKKSVHYINYVLGPSLIENNVNPSNQAELDQFLIDLDGTDNKSRYGANTILAVSLAVAKAVSKLKNIPFYQYIAELAGSPKVSRFVLPLPMVNVINGGAHADNTLDFQEFMFVPVGASSMHEAIRISAECFHSLAKYLKKKGMSTAKGDEGGFAPNVSSTEEALNAMMLAIEKAGYVPGVMHGHVAIALDCAASELYDKNAEAYRFKKAIKAGLLSDVAGTKSSAEMIDYYVELVNKYPIISIEDPLDENDFEGFTLLQKRLGDKVQIVGDDLYCTNPQLTQMGIDKGLSNAILIKVNQIGTLSETLKTMQLAKGAGWSCIVSHRSGETEDTTIADIAVGTMAGQIKTGSFSRSERVAKYNRLAEIEIELTSANSTFYGLYSMFSLDFNNTELFKVKRYLVNEATGEVKSEIVKDAVVKNVTERRVTESREEEKKKRLGFGRKDRKESEAKVESKKPEATPTPTAEKTEAEASVS